MDERSYDSWSALDRAVKDSMTRDTASSLSTSDRYQQFIFDRFLTRVFNDDNSPWLLKGGTGMLARISGARRTRDVDLSTTPADVEDAIEDLRRRIEHSDLGDHLTFIVSSEKGTGRGEGQPETASTQLSIECLAGQRRITRFHVDVAVGPPPTGVVELVEPVGRVELNRPLKTKAYRLFPLVDSIAEKVSATMSTVYPMGASSRTKDLVDLAIIARTQTVDLRALQVAIATQRARTRQPEYTEFDAPAAWSQRFQSDAIGTPAAGMTFDDALELTRSFINPALAPEPILEARVWTPGPTENDARSGEVPVVPHRRDGHPVVGHWRSLPRR